MKQSRVYLHVLGSDKKDRESVLALIAYELERVGSKVQTAEDFITVTLERDDG